MRETITQTSSTAGTTFNILTVVGTSSSSRLSPNSSTKRSLGIGRSAFPTQERRQRSPISPAPLPHCYARIPTHPTRLVVDAWIFRDSSCVGTASLAWGILELPTNA